MPWDSIDDDRENDSFLERVATTEFGESFAAFFVKLWDFLTPFGQFFKKF